MIRRQSEISRHKMPLVMPTEVTPPLYGCLAEIQHHHRKTPTMCAAKSGASVVTVSHDQRIKIIKFISNSLSFEPTSWKRFVDRVNSRWSFNAARFHTAPPYLASCFPSVSTQVLGGQAKNIPRPRAAWSRPHQKAPP